MLSNIASILQSIGEFFSSVVSFVTKLFSDLVYIVELIGSTVAQIPDYLSFFPAWLLPAVISVFAVVVIYKVLGRD